MSAAALRSQVLDHLPPSVRHWLHHRRVQQQIGSYCPRLITRAYCGHELTLRLEDPLAEGWYRNGWPHDLPEVEEARAHGLRPGATVFDIGAHQGVVALILTRIVGPTGRVVAVEGEAHNARVARSNAQLNGAWNLVVDHAVCASTPGEIEFAESLNGHAAPRQRTGTRMTRSVTIDNLAHTHGAPDVVYVDIEGFELEALRGATETLQSDATFVVEVHAERQLQSAGGSVEEVVGLLVGSGRRLWWVPETEHHAAHGLRPVEGALPSDQRFFLLAAS